MNIAWDAAEYESNFSFVHQYGANVLDLVDEGHGGLAVDLGCGIGSILMGNGISTMSASA